MKRSLGQTILGLLVAMAALATRAEPPEEDTVITSEQVQMFNGDTQNRFLFERDVVITGTNLNARCDELEVIVKRQSKKLTPPANAAPGIGVIERIELRGSVVIEQLGRRATAGRAEILPREGRVVLMDGPRVTDGESVVTGWRMVLHRDQRRVEVHSNPDAAEGSPEGRTRIILPAVPDLGYDGADQSPE